VGQALAVARRIVCDCKRCAFAAAARFAAARNARDYAGCETGAIDGAAG
jgi:hypothetical protein